MMPLTKPEKRQTTPLISAASAEGETVARRYSEQGYMLVTVAVLIMVVVSMLSSVVFVSTRQGKFKENYATGERLAALAPMAHAYVQTAHYISGTTMNGDVVNLMDLPDNFSFTKLTDTDFSVEVIARNAMPVAIPATPGKAASAYIHLRIRPKVGMRNPTDTVALQSGANHGGMGRLGFFQTGIPAGDTCDSAATVVRWGPEADSCLNQSQSDSLFTDIQPGDIVVPAWETALAKMDRDAMMRFPQPGRPDLNSMMTDLAMANNDITAAQNIRSETLVQRAGGRTSTNNFVVQQGKAIRFNQSVTAANGLIVNPDTSSGQAMQVDPGVVVTFNNAVNIADTLQAGAVKAANNITTENIGTATRNLNISQWNAPLNVGVKRMTGVPKDIEILGVNGRLAVSGTLDTTATTLRSTDVFAGRLDTSNTAVFTNGGSLVTINAQSLDQKGNAGSLTAYNINIGNRCDGIACPNNSTIPDPDPPLGN